MKKISLLVLIFFCFCMLFAFDWPQNVESIDEFSCFFGESRHATFSNSLIFENPDEIKASETGTVLIKMNSGVSDMGWFESTLGNTVILSHENSLLTVYGNLETINLHEDASIVTKDTKVGTSGSSGWQQGKNSLEFQVIDTKMNTFINPLILMPTIEGKKNLSNISLYATNKENERFTLVNNAKIKAGIYKLFINKQQSSMLYKTSISVNGALVESIVFDVLAQNNNQLCVKGNENYSFLSFYPTSDSQLLGEVILSKGKNTIVVTAEDFFGNTKTATFSITVE